MNLGFVIPTKDRPRELKRLLSSLLKQSKKKDRIVVVCSGNKKIFLNLQKQFLKKVIFLYQQNSGQVQQRKLGIQKLVRYKWICFLDDDIVLLPDAVMHMRNYLSARTDGKLGAVSFNLINEEKHKKRSFGGIYSFLGIRPAIAGKISASGCIGSIASVEKTIKTEWVLGGATCWRSSILKNNPNKAPVESWAFAEDVNFSFPLREQWDLMVLKDAKALHLHPHQLRPNNWHSMALERQFYYGYVFNKKYFPKRRNAFYLHQMLVLVLSFCRSLINPIENTKTMACKLLYCLFRGPTFIEAKLKKSIKSNS